MPSERVLYLLEQLASGANSPEEEKELTGLLSDKGNREDFINALEILMAENKTGPEWNGKRLDSMVQNILVTDRTGKRIINPGKKIFSISQWAAAAVIIILFGAGSYFLFFNKPKSEIVQTQGQRFKNDVLPGGNKAILTLANGRQIILDSEANGTLAQQGNVNIIKTGSGRLAYNILTEKPTEVLYNLLTTPNGGQYQLQLPDGSKVWLNAASSIKYPTAFTGKEREVEVTGEAYFEIAHNPKMPFHVKVGNETIKDLGTHFNINAYDDEPNISTTLLEGSVQVKTPNNGIILSPGQQAQVQKNGEMQLVKDANTGEVVAWKDGRFEFNGNIQGIMRQLARWYDANISIEGNIPDAFVANISRNEPVSKMLKLMELTGRVHFKIDGKKITVLP